MSEISENAKRVLIFQYILENGSLPAWAGEDGATAQMKIFGRISGMNEADTAAAYAELEDAGMMGREQ